MHSPTLRLQDIAATEAAGARIAPHLAGGMVITLSGALGAGKTTLVRGALRALGWRGRVKSPTYTLVEHYSFPSLYLYHIDLYRFEDAAEWEQTGLADCFRDDSVCIVEWPERVGSLLPPADLAVTIEHASDADARTLRARAGSEAGERCASALVNAALA
jgi:tRNA threonylcarbamoyladenosine biosynthesis protein TsaE